MDRFQKSCNFEDILQSHVENINKEAGIFTQEKFTILKPDDGKTLYKNNVTNLENIEAVTAFLSIDKNVVECLKANDGGRYILLRMIETRSQREEGSFEISEDIQHKIYNLFPGQEKEKQRNTLTTMYKIVALYKISPQKFQDDPRVFKRSITGFPISVLATSDGKQYGIFKDSEIGKGGTKVVFDAIDLNELQAFAYSKLTASNNSTSLKLIKSEVDYMKFFNTDGFVKLFLNLTYFSKDGRHVKSGNLMEKCKGSFFDLIADNKFNLMRPLQKLAFLKKSLRSIDTLHKNNVHHRDIKLENFLIAADGENPKLIDFGLAIDINLEAQTEKPGVGTDIYLSPEQAKGSFLYQEGLRMFEQASKTRETNEFLLKGIEKEKVKLEKKLKLLSKNTKAEQNCLKALALNKNRARHANEKILEAYHEQLKGQKEMVRAREIGIKISADIWAFGICLYALRTGVCPLNFRLPTFLENLRGLTQEEILRWFSPNIQDDPIEILNLKMLVLNADDRITAEEAINDIEKLEKALAEFY